MYIARLDADEWNGTSDHGLTIEHPSLEQVEQAIRVLDGKRTTLVTLTASGETHMAIGGGTDNQYIVYVTFDNVEFWEAQVPVASKNVQETVTLLIGGQEGEYPRHYCVDVETAVQAATHFAGTSTLSSDVGWHCL